MTQTSLPRVREHLVERWNDPWVVALSVGLGYALGSEAAFRFADATDLQAVFFIPSGITLAALVRLPRTRWWVVLAAIAAAEMVQDLRADLTVVQSAGFVLANAVEPVVGASIIGSAVRRRVDLTRLWDVRWFIIGGVVAGPAIGAAIGSTVDRAIGGDEFVTTLWQWWLGDALGVLLVGGALLAIGSSPDRRSLWSQSGLLLIIGSVALTVTVLSLSDLPLMFIMLTGVVVAGARFGVRAVSLVSVIVAVTAAVVFAFEGDVMVGVSDATGLIVIKLKFLVFTVGGLVVAAEVHERDLMVLEHLRLEVAAAEEHRLAERFQRLSLPAETMSGQRFTARGRYFAASSGLGVGGDWYDVVELPDGRVYICVGDVVGHGPEAAVTMSQLKVAMSILAAGAAGPADLLARVDGIGSTIPGASCSTAWVGYFEPETGVVTWSSAGHPPAFLVRDGRVERLDGSVAAPITVQPDRPKPEWRIELDGEASLVLYTDGLVERRHGTIDEAIDDVAAQLEAAGSGSAGLDLDAFERLAGETDDSIVLHVVLRPSPPA
ncbi:MAG: SpoIIE family protein phosphatase [Ilumatobacter sp.]|nr:SpoIIE family protein phosphatase [Ilumatobacter sp.]